LNSNLDSYEHQIYQHLIDPSAIDETLNSIGGLSGIKEDIRMHVLMPLKQPKLFFSSKQLTPSKGILFHGPPGTGKTMLARAIASEAKASFLSLSLSSLENKYYGESSKLIRGTFSLAKKIQPSIVFFDEIDGLLKKRSDFDQSAVYGFKTELLSQIDGMESKASDAIFVIGTTNNLSSLDDAIKRRLPRVYEIKRPNFNERIEIFRLKLSEERIVDETLLSWLSGLTDNFSGSDIQELLKQAFGNRLKDQMTNDEFKEKLLYAESVDELPDMIALDSCHFEVALENFPQYHETLKKIKDLEEDEEEAPPE
jgi:SpoVK/Ycf46/Vps4 family AAA+-type ATPase